MKLIIMITTMVLSVSVQASFLQESCSSADSSVIKNMGHVKSELSVKYYGHGTEGKRLELDRFATSVEYSNEVTIKEESYNSCDVDPNSGGGYASWDSYYVQDIVITNDDGSEFPENLYGLSQDKKSITATILCHKAINNVVMCPKN